MQEKPICLHSDAHVHIAFLVFWDFSSHIFFHSVYERWVIAHVHGSSHALNPWRKVSLKVFLWKNNGKTTIFDRIINRRSALCFANHLNFTFVFDAVFFQNTALHIAARAGHVSAVGLLLDLNASFVRNNEGSTCFTEAIINQNREVALAIVQVLQFRVKRPQWPFH